MSYEKHVYAARLPENLRAAWLDDLAARSGLEVAFHPDFDLDEWGDGYLPCKVRAQPGSFPASDRYGNEAVDAGFELTTILDPEEISEILDEYETDMEMDGNPLPRDLAARLKASPALFCFTHGGFSWTVADFRVCWYAAATLARVTGGLLFDEWAEGPGHGYCGAEEAIRLAGERSESYQADPKAGATAWDLSIFSGWQD